MRVAILLGGWFVTSLLAGPWIGRFVGTHVKARETPMAANSSPADTEPRAAKPIRLAHRA
jgi:hypothetical protein